MQLPSNQITFLQLVRLGIGHRTDNLIPDQIDWSAIQALADRQGLSAIVLDGIETLSDGKRPSQGLLLEWIGEVLQAYEYRYNAYRKAIVEMAAFYREHGLKMMVIKGYACGINWPKSEHRPYGDIDIWLFGKQREADVVLAKEKGIKVDCSHQHHTAFYWRDFMVENHYDFNNVHHHKSSMKLEKIFKELGIDDSNSVEVDGEKVYLPSPNLHTLFLLKHSMTDFAAFYVNLRQVLDWGFHVERYHNEIDWVWLKKVIEEYHMTEFFNTINAICVDDLGFNSDIFPCVQFNPMLKDKVLEDIFEPKFTREEPRLFIPRLVYKFRRWKGNAWKHQMCYNESMWSAFLSGMKNHLLKPSSI